MRLAKLLIAALLVWSLYWAAAAWGLKNGIAAWFEAQENRGWQAEYMQAWRPRAIRSGT